MNLMYLTFGDNLNNHTQACFSIATFLKNRELSINNIVVYTDRPSFYRVFGKHVECIVISDKKLKKWEGKYCFFWRIKIKAIQECVLRFPQQPLMYLDSDTFLYSNLDYIEKKLNIGNSFMHLKEGSLSKLSTKTDKKMWSKIKGKTFSGITINEDTAMWNAGVIALPVEKRLEVLESILNSCDQMCALGVRQRLIEQFSFSIVLEHYYCLLEAKSAVGHYWGNKLDWNNEIYRFFTYLFLENRELGHLIESLDKIDLKSIPVVKKEKTIYKKIKKIFSNDLKYKEIEMI